MNPIRRFVRKGLSFVCAARYRGQHVYSARPVKVCSPPLRRRIQHVWDRTETLAVEDIALAPALVRPYLVAHERALVQAKAASTDLLAGAAR